jgi:hypothetical protein
LPNGSKGREWFIAIIAQVKTSLAKNDAGFSVMWFKYPWVIKDMGSVSVLQSEEMTKR